MTDESDIFFHSTPNLELCIDQQPHDFKGWKDIYSDDGKYIRGGTTVCTKCGLDAMTHSLRYGI